MKLTDKPVLVIELKPNYTVDLDQKPHKRYMALGFWDSNFFLSIKYFVIGKQEVQSGAIEICPFLQQTFYFDFKNLDKNFPLYFLANPLRRIRKQKQKNFHIKIVYRCMDESTSEKKHNSFFKLNWKLTVFFRGRCCTFLLRFLWAIMG